MTPSGLVCLAADKPGGWSLPEPILNPTRRTNDRSARTYSDIRARTRTVGDSFDNALAETVNGYYKAELIRGPAKDGPWKTVADVELATLGWVHWHNTTRLHGYLHDRPPAEHEKAFYAAQRDDRETVEIP